MASASAGLSCNLRIAFSRFEIMVETSNLLPSWLLGNTSGMGMSVGPGGGAGSALGMSIGGSVGAATGTGAVDGPGWQIAAGDAPKGGMAGVYAGCCFSVWGTKLAVMGNFGVAFSGRTSGTKGPAVVGGSTGTHSFSIFLCWAPDETGYCNSRAFVCSALLGCKGTEFFMFITIGP